MTGRSAIYDGSSYSIEMKEALKRFFWDFGLRFLGLWISDSARLLWHLFGFVAVLLHIVCVDEIPLRQLNYVLSVADLKRRYNKEWQP